MDHRTLSVICSLLALEEPEDYQMVSFALNHELVRVLPDSTTLTFRRPRLRGTNQTSQGVSVGETR